MPADLAARRLALVERGDEAGVSSGVPYGGGWRSLSASLRAQNPRCGVCGIRGDQQYQGDDGEWHRPRLTVHHRDHNPLNNDPDNLLVACDVCHGADTTHNYGRG